MEGGRVGRLQRNHYAGGFAAVRVGLKILPFNIARHILRSAKLLAIDIEGVRWCPLVPCSGSLCSEPYNLC
jgi:hypothetical protein